MVSFFDFLFGKKEPMKGVKKAAGAVEKIRRKVHSVKQKADYGRKVAKAAGRLAVRTTKGTPRMLVRAAKGKGMILPGSKYIGPGNAMNLGKPKNKADAAAYQHDKDYDAYLKKGHKAKDVYLGYSDADKRLIKRSDPTKASGLATWSGMQAKRLLNKTGLTKRIRDTDDPKKGKGKGK